MIEENGKLYNVVEECTRAAECKSYNGNENCHNIKRGSEHFFCSSADEITLASKWIPCCDCNTKPSYKTIGRVMMGRCCD